MKAFERYDRWIFEEFQSCARGLPLFRIVFALYLLGYYLPRFGQLAEMPHSFFRPPFSLATFIPSVPPAWFFYSLDFAAELAAFCLLFGYRTRIASFALFASILVGNTYRFSIGPKIDHEILLLITPLFFAFSGWGNSLSHDEILLPRSERRNTISWPITLLIAVTSYCMLTAALPKALSGWANPHVLACRGFMLGNYLLDERPSIVADGMLKIQSALFWKGADYSTLIIEGGFIICMCSLTASRVIMAFATLFHALIFYSMTIFFAANLVTYACLLDFRRFLWNGRVRHMVSRFRRIAHRVRFVHLFGMSIALIGLFKVLNLLDVDVSFLANNFLMVGSVSIAIVALLHFLAAMTDRLVFGQDFPLRSNHSLVILYDGECGLCDKWVQFVLKHDLRALFRFAPLQSQRGKDLLTAAGSEPSDLSSMILIIDKKAYVRSTGPLMILRQLGGVWSLLGIFGLVPTPIRDLVYATVAANRYRWFGKSNESCRLLYPHERERFIA